MFSLNYELLQFEHMVEFAQDATTFAAARDSSNGHIWIFLVNERNGNVYTRNGRVEAWEQLSGSERDTIVNRIIAARNSNIPVYKVNGANSAAAH